MRKTERDERTVASVERGRIGSNRLLVALGACGPLSAFALILATVLGDALRADYDPIAQSISELYEVGAPNAQWLMALFTAYHLLVIPLAVGLYMGLPRGSKRGLAPLLLGLAGLIGIPLGSYARCDPGCFDATTFQGQLHGVLVVVTVPLILSAMFAVWHRLRSETAWSRYRRYTLATLISSVGFGLVMLPFMQGPYTGLLERVSVFLIVQWYAFTGVRLIVESRRS